MFDLQVSANRPAQLPQALLEHHVSCLCLRIVRCERHEHADASHALGLLRVSGERTGRYRAAEKCDELAPPHCRPRASLMSRLSQSSCSTIRIKCLLPTPKARVQGIGSGANAIKWEQ